MLQPGDDHPCEGCCLFVDNLGHPAHLHARDTSLVLVSQAPPAEIEKRRGWTRPWFSSTGNGFDADFGVTGSLPTERSDHSQRSLNVVRATLT